MISAVTVAELLVRPSATGLPQALAVQTALRKFPYLRIDDFGLDLAVEAARVRALTRLKLPDAMVIATALASGVDALVHADDEWDAKAAPYETSIRFINLNQH